MAVNLFDAVLQWGRSFSERRTFKIVHDRQNVGGLQWGRSFSERRTRTSSRPSGQRRCFNGAALFQSGERIEIQGAELQSRASMGPLFFRAENTTGSPCRMPAHRLQWGRSFSERRTLLSTVGACCPLRLQWGRSFSERRTAVSPAGIRRMDATLQWGRSFSERRTSRAFSASVACMSRFNGAALFQSGELSVAAGDTPRTLASMGPLFFRAENVP